MGVGKTAEVIRALDLRRAMRGIIVCPAAVRENWRGEFLKFGIMQRRVCKGSNIHDYVAWSRDVFDVLVLSYEMAAKFTKHLADLCEPLDFVVFDEAHYMKEAETKRAKALIGNEANGRECMTTWAIASWWVTGTPVPNDPIDIWTFLRFCRVMPLDKKQFSDRYFSSWVKTYNVAHEAKPEMLSEIQALIANNSIRRSLAETGIQLPPVFLTSVLVDGDTQAVRDMLLQHPGLDEAIKRALEDGGSLAKIKTDHIATLRRLIGEAKAVPYASMLLWELNNGLDKMVCFGIHRLSLSTVAGYLSDHHIGNVSVTGDTSERDRQAAMHRFQHDPSCRVLLGNIKAAGTGLTLTASCNIDMLESDWTPAGNAQALKRVHRISQTRSVRARFITLARSFDEDVNAIVAKKTAAIAAIEGRG